MSETVEQRLEAFVPVFEQLITLGLFTREEVKIIIKKRRNFESNLISRSADVSAYLKYINYEAAVIALTDERKIKHGIESNDRLLSDAAWPKHIHTIFRRACHRFPGDMSIWNLYFKYCQETRSTKMLSSAFSDCIKIHSNDPDLWIRIANWEMNENGNCELAMKYLAQAIQIIPENPKLHALYAETVLHQSTIIEQRREITEIQEKFDMLKIPLRIYEHALEQCPDQAEVLKCFIESFKNYQQPIDKLIEIAEQLHNPSVLSIIAENSDNPIEKFQNYIQSIQDDSKLHEIKIKFADYLCTRPSNDQNALKIFIDLLNEFEDFSNEESERYTDHLLECNELEEAATFLEDDLSTPRLKLLKLKLLHLQNPQLSDFEKVSQSLLLLNPTDTDLGSYFLRACAEKECSPEKWNDLVKKLSIHITPSDCSKALLLDLVKYGPENANTLLNDLLKLIIPTPEFLQTARKVVNSQQIVDEARLRGLLELGCSRWPQNIEVWLDAIRFEFEHKNWKAMESIRWRAKSLLEDSSEFEKEYQLEFCKGND